MSFIVNSFSVPNALVDDVLASIPPSSLKCYMVIVRKTTGWSKTKDKISVSQLQQLSGIKDERTVSNACQKLVEMGLIIVHKKRGQINEYELITQPDFSKNVPTKNVPTKNEGTTKTTPKKCGWVPPKNEGTTTPKKCGSTKDTTKNTNTKNIYTPTSGECVSHESALEIISNFQKPKFSKSDLIDIFSIDSDVVESYIEVRTAKKAPLTKLAFKKLTNQAKDAGLTIEEAMTVCAERNWVGFEASWVKSDNPASKESNISTEFEDYESANWGVRS